MLFTDLILAGSHDSAAYKLNRNVKYDFEGSWESVVNSLSLVTEPILRRWTCTQKLSIADQLKVGIRSFDFRVSYGSGRFWFSHTFACVRAKKALKQVRRFMDDHPDQVVLLRFKSDHAHYKDMADRIDAFLAEVVQLFGNRLLPRHSRLRATVEDMIADNQRIVVDCATPHKRNKYVYDLPFYKMSEFPADPKVKKRLIREFVKEAPPADTRHLAILPMTLTPDIETVLNPFDQIYSTEALSELIAEKRYRWMNKLNLHDFNSIDTDFVDARFVAYVHLLNVEKSLN